MDERPEYNNPHVPENVARILWAERKINSLGQFEDILREMESKVYLIAGPLDEDYITFYPVPREDQPEYSLYIAKGWGGDVSKLLRNKLLRKLGITPEENRYRLDKTGIRKEKY